MSAPDRGLTTGAARPSASGQDWARTSLLLVATGVAFGGMGGVLAGWGWWLTGMTLAASILFTGVIVRSFVAHRLWSFAAGLLVATGVFTAFNAPDASYLGFIPTRESLELFGELEAAGRESIATQGVPAEADAGILYLVCLGIAALVFAMELFVSGARMPVLTGLPLLVLLLVPGFVDPALHDPLTFLFTAVCYLGLLLVGRRGTGRTAVAIGAAALTLAVLLPPALPGVQRPPGVGAAANAGLNPLISLGEDLRRDAPVIAYTYSSSEGGGDYFRLTALDDFEGLTWSPDTERANLPGIDEFGTVPGLASDVLRTEVRTQVTVGDIDSAWLPLPYAPRAVTGLDGEWNRDPTSFAVLGDGSNARGQDYVVDSLAVTPVIEQLLAAGKGTPAGFEQYISLPDDLPPVVAELAGSVAGHGASNYESAIALQAWFRSSAFTYSEEAPVEAGYDGSGAAVLDDFLAARKGYCVHFASAMAAMARTLGIPARMVVGFTPGAAVLQEGKTVYRVTTHEFHAWPELYFEGVGWVRFEPTPGRGDVPAFALATRDDPSTPDIDESSPVRPPESPVPGTVDPLLPDRLAESAAPGRARDGAAPARPQAPAFGALAALLIAAVLATPAVVRAGIRQRRMLAVRRGSALAAWTELGDTLHDLGSPVSAALTPRQVADLTASRLSGTAAEALGRLTAGLEREAYSPRADRVEVRDLRTVRRALSLRASPLNRVLAILTPRSLPATLSARLRERSVRSRVAS